MDKLARSIPLFLAACAMAAAMHAAHAQTQVLFDDGTVRVQEVRFKPGDEGPSIPRPFRVIRVLEGGAMDRIHPDGRTERVQLKTGEVTVHEADGPYVPRNVGNSDIVLYVVALKKPDAGWTTLIEGAKGLENWNRIGDANWRAEGGAIVADAGAGYLVSRVPYGNFELRAEFWADAATNSGVFMRLADPVKVTSKNAYEVNIYDGAPNPSYGTGAIVNVAAVSPMPRAAGRWNTYEITANGEHLVVKLNGVETANALDSRFAKGPVALQFRGGKVKWRNVQVRELRSRN